MLVFAIVNCEYSLCRPHHNQYNFSHDFPMSNIVPKCHSMSTSRLVRLAHSPVVPPGPSLPAPAVTRECQRLHHSDVVCARHGDWLASFRWSQRRFLRGEVRPLSVPCLLLLAAPANDRRSSRTTPRWSRIAPTRYLDCLDPGGPLRGRHSLPPHSPPGRPHTTPAHQSGTWDKHAHSAGNLARGEE